LKILVTGASGLLGSTLCPFLINNGFEVIPHRKKKDSKFKFCDLTDSISTASFLEEQNPDFIIHLSAMTDVDYAEQNPIEAFLMNSKSCQHLKEFAIQKSVPIIYISSDQVYSGSGPHIEDHTLPLNYYGITKLCGEYEILQAGGTCLRTNFFGPSLSLKKSFSDWAIDSLKNETPIQLFSDIYFSPVHINSLCIAIKHVIENPINSVFNVGSQEGLSKADFINTIARIGGFSTKNCTEVASQQIKGARAPRPFDMRLNSEKFFNSYPLASYTLKQEIEKIFISNGDLN
jgi:dTDP-4-dehydrorhamnose reductase